MKKCLTATALLISLTALAMSQDQSCPTPRGMSEDQKRTCVQRAHILLDQPELSDDQIANGPDFDPDDPDGSRFRYFLGEDEVTCYFRPHYAFNRVKGRSLKLQCWQLDEERSLLDRAGAKIPVTSVKIVIEKNNRNVKRSRLFASDDAANENRIRADRFKVKYLDRPIPNHNKRFREVFTEVAANRIMWVLGIPADHAYPAALVKCVGCQNNNPFGSNQKENRAALTDPGIAFQTVSIEREHPFEAIDQSGNEYWSWRDTANFHGGSQWTRRQKVEFDAYRLALRLINYHNTADQQNRVACAEEGRDAQDNQICLRPMIFVQDLGSTFGKPATFSANPRGDYKAWQAQTVFKRPDRCELRAPLRADKQVFQEAVDLLLPRLERLDRATVERIFRLARFDVMDQGQIERLRNAGASDPGEAAIQEWTDTFMSRIAEIRAVQNCKP